MRVCADRGVVWHAAWVKVQGGEGLWGEELLMRAWFYERVAGRAEVAGRMSMKTTRTSRLIKRVGFGNMWACGHTRYNIKNSEMRCFES